ncbi:NAD(P)/FAD-dependent oxidoreductase [Methyloferula stellata]|uniref:NAD(P)/FAD-dependent oxidoreductase n=1 Tax=Methyloferula stellata TaxID=876270 RepID=UPI0005903631|nr:NAD(P)/FAD-dependent oxidoreductase [Methyloferula stellata]
MDLNSKLPHVVIVGGGFGGLEVARGLKDLPVCITLTDRQNHHCFQPLLYQVATAVLSPADIAWPIRGILRAQPNARVIMAEVTGVDTAAKIVHTDSIDLPYDYLVLATGATHSYFGHDEWERDAPGLKRITDATELRRRLLIAFEEAELTDDGAKQRSLLTFVIVGAGPTGVEMAGAIAEVALQTLPPEFREVDPASARIILIEAGPRVLPSFPEDLSAYTQKSLEKMGVEVMTGTRVTKCDKAGVDIEGGRIDAHTVIWAAGVVASPAAKWIGAPADYAGRVEVLPDLSVPDHPDIFAVGDTAAVFYNGGKSVPGIAPAAKQMGKYVAKLIASRLKNKPAPPPFAYKHQGDLATIGRRIAVVKLPNQSFALKGFIGWLFWSLAHVYFLIGIRNRFVVAFTWLWQFLTLQRSARIISQVPKWSKYTAEEDT